MKLKSIRQTVTIPAGPEKVYDVLMNSKQHAKLIGSTARIGKKSGDKFSAYDDYIRGTNIELVPGKKIVQEWQTNERNWPKNHYSKLTLKLVKVKDGTKINLFQSGVPANYANAVKKGWINFYWKPMKQMLEK